MNMHQNLSRLSPFQSGGWRLASDRKRLSRRTSLLACHLLLCLAASATAAFAGSPAQVQQRLASGEKVTFVDVRPTSLFQEGHIPGAINVPAGLVAEKELPPLGRVVVYDDGLGVKTAETAAAALGKKQGITAEVLDGGFAGWETAKGQTTQRPGFKSEALPVITYAHLKQAQASDVVLVDLRKAPEAAGRVKSANSPALTDLSAEFPKARVAHSPFDGAAGATSNTKDAAAAPPPLLVLIDNNDGSAEATARTLKANGITRFVILAGGEEILARKGEKGLQRIGNTIQAQRRSGLAPTPAANTPIP
jgi:rhodanese-related sulfurtransferase